MKIARLCRLSLALSLVVVLAVCALSVFGATPRASALTGGLDPSFGSGGTVSALTTDWTLGAFSSVLPDGVAAGQRGPVVTGQRDGRVIGLTDSGTVDTGFGTGGTADLPVGFLAEEVIALTDGDLLVVGASRFARDSVVVLTSAGHVEPSFHGGLPLLAVPAGWYIERTAARPGGGASLFEFNVRTGEAAVVALGPDGSADVSFATGGTLSLTSSLALGFPTPAAGWDVDGSFFVVRVRFGRELITRYSAAGTVVTSFGTDGTADLGELSVTALVGTVDGGVAISAQPQGRVGPAEDRTHRLMLGPTGALRNEVTFSNSLLSSCRLLARTDRHVLARPSGGAFFVGDSLNGGECVTPSAAVDAYGSDGQPDTAFAPQGTFVIAGQTGAHATIDGTGRVYVGGRTVFNDGVGQDRLSRIIGLESGSSFSSLVPGRLLDSRPGALTVDGQFAAIGLRAAGSITELTVAGRGGVPVDAAAVVLNVTVTEAQGAGYITVWPCGTARPNASSLNYITGSTVANAVIAKIGTDGKICLYTQSATHLLADVNGYYVP